MNFGWESDKERLLRYMRIPPGKKLKWLQAMHDLTLSMATPERKKIFWKLRGVK